MVVVKSLFTTTIFESHDAHKTVAAGAEQMSLFEAWSPAIITAMSAVRGSLVSALGSTPSTWMRTGDHYPVKRSHALCLLLLFVISVGLSAQVSPAVSDLPSNQQVLDFLTGSIDWYRQRSIERQIAIDPGDLVFLEDNAPIAVQIVQLSFDFARADALAASTFSAGNLEGSTIASSLSPDLAQFIQSENRAEVAARQASQQIEDIKEKLLTSRGAERRRLQAALDATRSRVEVLQAATTMLQHLVEFSRSFGGGATGDLGLRIDDLARTVPDVTNPTAAGSQAQRADLPSVAKPADSGILSLSSQVSALGRKLRILDDEILRTDKLTQSSESLRTPLRAAVNKRFLTGIANDFQASDLSVLQQQKDRLDELTALFKALSPGIVSLDKQKLLFDAYTQHLKNWRAAVVIENEKAWRNLILRLASLAAVIGALAMIGAVARREIRHHIQDPHRRAIMLVIQRVVLWFTVVIVAALSLASDLASLATFFGLLTAGIAVALQSVIVSALGYFMLVGRLGIRAGDRVQISGVTGDVTEIGWLQFQLRQIDEGTQRPTGRIVTFSNSFVFLSPATGLSKFNPEDVKPAKSADNRALL